MADANDTVLDKAENLARRVLERLGSKVDSKLASGKEQTLSSQVISDLASRIEHVVDYSLKEDEHGIRKVAPNRFKVLFTYEETSALSEQYIEAVGKELTAAVFEYINNRRYATRGPVEVNASRDLFTKTTALKASFDGVNDQVVGSPQKSPVPQSERSKHIGFNSADGRSYRVELKPEGAPAYIGRAAGNAVRLDDPSVSRLHCSITLKSSGAVVIADVGSANGTYVNEHHLARDETRLLQPGDVVGVGDFRLTVSEIS